MLSSFEQYKKTEKRFLLEPVYEDEYWENYYFEEQYKTEVEIAKEANRVDKHGISIPVYDPLDDEVEEKGMDYIKCFLKKEKYDFLIPYTNDIYEYLFDELLIIIDNFQEKLKREGSNNDSH